MLLVIVLFVFIFFKSQINGKESRRSCVLKWGKLDLYQLSGKSIGLFTTLSLQLWVSAWLFASQWLHHCSVEDLFRFKGTLWYGQHICSHQYPRCCYEMCNSAFVISFFNSHVMTVEITSLEESWVQSTNRVSHHLVLK